jgi:antitoxin MazE
VEVILAQSDQGRGVLGVIDGSSPKGVEKEDGIAWRKELLRKFKYKLWGEEGYLPVLESINVLGLDKGWKRKYLFCRYILMEVFMKTRVQKWGNSLALRIPKSFATEAGLDRDSSVEVSLIDGKLTIVPDTRPKFTLKQLLSQVTNENLHHEVDTGPAMGNEAW